ncbi:hypothetical protein [Alphaentomopoxvirus acuprea]|uniref:Uncharacterized protein n=1 Tax=Alphaentomopoxvirus acuprea TaxID=62099 RepID=W6JL01_9POXV|nr:hypothetical protein BA82_gp125 [Anomala cuprea entomopoxvirus]BAO49485.1 hypothetical protein [Anomala cuprea entomopoxvirus]
MDEHVELINEIHTEIKRNKYIKKRNIYIFILATILIFITMFGLIIYAVIGNSDNTPVQYNITIHTNVSSHDNSTYNTLSDISNNYLESNDNDDSDDYDSDESDEYDDSDEYDSDDDEIYTEIKNGFKNNKNITST